MFKYSKDNYKISRPKQRIKCSESQVCVGTSHSKTKQGRTGGSSVNNSGGNRDKRKGQDKRFMSDFKLGSVKRGRQEGLKNKKTKQKRITYRTLRVEPGVRDKSW